MLKPDALMLGVAGAEVRLTTTAWPVFQLEGVKSRLDGVNVRPVCERATVTLADGRRVSVTWVVHPVFQLAPVKERMPGVTFTPSTETMLPQPSA